MRTEKTTVHGKMRRYYEATEKGLKILEDSREKIKELVDEVLK